MTTKRAISLAALILFAAITLFPIYWMVMTAVMPPARILSRDPALLPEFGALTLDGFFSAIERRPLFTWLINSLVVALAATAASLFVSALAGYSLSRWQNSPQHILGASLLLSKLIPSGLIIIPLFIMFNFTGLIDSYGGLVLAHMTAGVPLATWLLKGFFDRIPRELEQAATIDGCSQLQAMRLIVLPLARPGLAACAVYLMIISWGEFIFARTLMTDRDHLVLTVGLQSFVGEQMVDWAGLMAAGTISLLPVIILFVILEPFLVSGMTKGGLAN